MNSLAAEKSFPNRLRSLEEQNTDLQVKLAEARSLQFDDAKLLGELSNLHQSAPVTDRLKTDATHFKNWLLQEFKPQTEQSISALLKSTEDRLAIAARAAEHATKASETVKGVEARLRSLGAATVGDRAPETVEHITQELNLIVQCIKELMLVAHHMPTVSTAADPRLPPWVQVPTQMSSGWALLQRCAVDMAELGSKDANRLLQGDSIHRVTQHVLLVAVQRYQRLPRSPLCDAAAKELKLVVLHLNKKFIELDKPPVDWPQLKPTTVTPPPSPVREERWSAVPAPTPTVMRPTPSPVKTEGRSAEAEEKLRLMHARRMEKLRMQAKRQREPAHAYTSPPAAAQPRVRTGPEPQEVFAADAFDEDGEGPRMRRNLGNLFGLLSE